MGDPPSTCWTMIRGASKGELRDRESFVRRYGPLVRSYLHARWKTSPLSEEIDDAFQEFFVECFRRGGALERASPEVGGSFRAFFYGVLRNVALRAESRRQRRRERQITTGVGLEHREEREARLSELFEREWARSILREAAARQEEIARESGAEALRRVEILRLRFHDDLPIREIARRLQADPVRLHREYAKARREFKTALCEVIAFYDPEARADVEEQHRRLLSSLVAPS